MYMARCRGNAKICLRLRAVTNLHSLGVDDKTIQGILRHSSLATTPAIYIKVIPSDVQAAMNRLESVLPNRAKARN
jgi:site-specific recombinase XerD